MAFAVMNEITCMQAVPGLMHQVLACMEAADQRSFPNMRQVTTGGDAVPPALLSRMRRTFPNAELSVTYGPTETAILASRFVPDDLSTPLEAVQKTVVSGAEARSPRWKKRK